MAAVLLRTLDLSVTNEPGSWTAGRFRDVYLNADGTEILLYTRNGGGNRQHYSDESRPGVDCGCTGCIITYKLPTHPEYLRDYDDDFDCTYATVAFRVPENYRTEMAAIATGHDPETVQERFTKLAEALESGQDSPEVVRAKEVGQRIAQAIHSGQSGVVEI